MKLIAATGLALVLGIGAAAAQTSTTPSTSGKSGTMQMTQAECDSTWSKLDTSKSGSVSQSQASSYVTDFKQADSNNDGRLSSAEFTSACQKGLVRSSAASTGSGSGASGTSGSSSSGSKGSSK